MAPIKSEMMETYVFPEERELIEKCERNRK